MDSSENGRGIGCLGIVLIVLVTLKLVGVAPVAAWSWWIVLAPMWFGLAILVCVLALVAAVAWARSAR